MKKSESRWIKSNVWLPRFVERPASLTEPQLALSIARMREGLVEGLRRLERLEAEQARRDRRWKLVFDGTEHLPLLMNGAFGLVESWRRLGDEPAAIDVTADRAEVGDAIALSIEWRIGKRLYGRVEREAQVHALRAAWGGIVAAFIAVDVACFGDRS